MEKFASQAELKAYLDANKGVTSLVVSGIADLVELPQLPSGLHSLWVTDCPSLVAIRELPDTLRRLSIRGCDRLEILPELMPNLTEWFGVSRCPMLKRLPPLPTTLWWLTVKDCSGLESLPSLEGCRQMDRLQLHNCPGLAHWPTALPTLLEFLVVENCGNVLPVTWQEALSRLWPGAFGETYYNDDSADPQDPHEVTGVMRADARRRFAVRARVHGLSREERQMVLEYGENAGI